MKTMMTMMISENKMDELQVFADAFAAVCTYHKAIAMAIQSLRFIEAMQPGLNPGSEFRVDPEKTRVMLAELLRAQNGAMSSSSSSSAVVAAAAEEESWSEPMA